MPLPDEDDALDREPSMTINEFLAVERMSRSSYYKMRALGYGPAEMHVPGTEIIRISARARAPRMASQARRAGKQRSGRVRAQAARQPASRGRQDRSRIAVASQPAPKGCRAASVTRIWSSAVTVAQKTTTPGAGDAEDRKAISIRH